MDMDGLDRALIARLKLDSRMSLTTLAAELGIARGTAQKRLASLVRAGVIRRFTVEVDLPDGSNLIEAVSLIRIEGNATRAVTARLRQMAEISSLHSTNGNWDLVATIQVANLHQFDRVLRKIREMAGVLNSETCLLLDRAV